MEVCNQTSSWGSHDFGKTSEDKISRRCSIHKKNELGSICPLALDSATYMPTEDGADHEYATYEDDDDDVQDGNEGGKSIQQHEHLQVECSMCGHMGLPQYLFKCLSCSCRFQHFYCSKLYPYRMEAAICNWCLPLKLEITTAEEDDDHSFLCKSVDSSIGSCYLPICPDPGRSQSYQVKQIKKHSKAFEYLLQIIAELADHHREIRCHESCSIHQTESTYEIVTDMGHDPADNQTNKICRFKEVDYNHHNSEVDNSDVHHVSLLQQSNNLRREDFERKRFSTRTGESKSHKAGASSAIISKRPRSHNDIWQPAQATNGGEHDMTIEDQNKSYNFKAGYLKHDLVLQNKRLTDYYEAISCLPGGSAPSPVAKRPRSNICKKRESLMGATEGHDCTDDGKANHDQGSILAAAAQMGFNGLNYVSSAATAVIDDDEGDRHGSESESRQMMCVAAMQKPAAGKRDHLINSPSRAFNRRYKLLADVLC